MLYLQWFVAITISFFFLQITETLTSQPHIKVGFLGGFESHNQRVIFIEFVLNLNIKEMFGLAHSVEVSVKIIGSMTINIINYTTID